MRFLDQVSASAKDRGGLRVGVITVAEPAEARCTVLVNDGEVLAYTTDQTVDGATVGARAVLQQLGETYLVIATIGGAPGGGVGVVFGPELLPNNSFEYGTDQPTGWGAWPWVGGDWTAVRDTTAGQAVSGDARFLVTLNAGPDQPIVRLWNADAVRVDAGATYQLAAWVKAPAGHSSLEVSLMAITAPIANDASVFGTGSTQTVVATIANPGAAYQLLTGLVTPPAGHNFMRVYLSSIADAAIPAPVTTSWDVASLRQRITT